MSCSTSLRTRLFYFTFLAEPLRTVQGGSWADLMRRAFDLDVLACPRGFGRGEARPRKGFYSAYALTGYVPGAAKGASGWNPSCFI